MDRTAGGPIPWRQYWPAVVWLSAITAVAWIVTVRMLADGAMDMGDGAAAASRTHWTTADFGSILLMWLVMMAAMMIPGAVPAILVFAAFNDRNHRRGTAGTETGFFVAGYLAIWSVFSLAATGLQGGLHHLRLLSSLPPDADALIGGMLMSAAGLYQWTPFKDACLRHCRTPIGLFATEWRPGAVGAVRMGLVHGSYCLGCCWLLMLLMFVGGAMNLYWMAALTALVFMEKLQTAGWWIHRLVGMALILTGAFTIAPLFVKMGSIGS